MQVNPASGGWSYNNFIYDHAGGDNATICNVIAGDKKYEVSSGCVPTNDPDCKLCDDRISCTVEPNSCGGPYAFTSPEAITVYDWVSSGEDYGDNPNADNVCVGNPVDPFTGRDIDSTLDIGYPPPSAVRVVRSYKSDNPTIGAFGKGTTTNFDHHLYYYDPPDDIFEYLTPGGARTLFTNASDGSYESNSAGPLKHAKVYHEDATDPRRIEFAGGGDIYIQLHLRSPRKAGGCP